MLPLSTNLAELEIQKLHTANHYIVLVYIE